MAFRATFEAPPREGTTFGCFGAVVIATDGHGRIATGSTAGVCAPPSSPPWPISLSPDGVNLDKNNSFFAFRRYELTPSAITRICITPCCDISYSSRWCSSWTFSCSGAVPSTAALQSAGIPHEHGYRAFQGMHHRRLLLLQHPLHVLLRMTNLIFERLFLLVS